MRRNLLRRRVLSEEELVKVISLRQAGTSWLKIQQKTGIDRRTAKREYERHAKEKLEVVRIQVATELFREHMESIVRTAEVLVNQLPQSMTFSETRDAEEVFREVWTTNSPRFNARISVRSEKDKQRILRENLMLFKSLKDHTLEQVRWEALGEWRRGWNECLGILTKIRSKAKEMVMSEIEKRDGTEERMAEVVVEALWLGIQDGKPKKSSDLVGTTVLEEGTILIVIGGKSKVVLEDKTIAKELAGVCKRVIGKLCEENSLIKLSEKSNPMETAIEELEEELHPYILRPIILKTQCDLCPTL